MMKEMGHAKCSMLAPRAQQIGLENDVMSSNTHKHTHIKHTMLAPRAQKIVLPSDVMSSNTTVSPCIE